MRELYAVRSVVCDCIVGGATAKEVGASWLIGFLELRFRDDE
jgi:hypothetical protein